MSASFANQYPNPDSFHEPVNPDNKYYSLMFVEPLRDDPAVERAQLDAGGSVSYRGVKADDGRVIGITNGEVMDEATHTRQALLAVIATNNGEDLFAVVSIASTPELYEVRSGGKIVLKGDIPPHRDRIKRLANGDGHEALSNRATALVHLNRDGSNDVIPVRTSKSPSEVTVRDDFTVGVDDKGAVTIAGSETAEGVEVFMRRFVTTYEKRLPTITREQLAFQGLRKSLGLRQSRVKETASGMAWRTHVAASSETELHDDRHWAIDPEQAGYLLDALAASLNE